MIKPTVGRVVWFRPRAEISGFTHHGSGSKQPCAAMIVHVWNDHCINLVAFDSNGASLGFTNVPLLQDDDTPPAVGYFAEWMPFQKGQAAKYDGAAEAAKTDAILAANPS